MVKEHLLKCSPNNTAVIVSFVEGSKTAMVLSAKQYMDRALQQYAIK
jgi:hypothetical protein